MAVDEVLMEQAAETSAPILRIYAWSEPTLSLGYFQSYADRVLHPPGEPCAVVRRSTGGGAILHDHEWTYSLAWPVGLSRSNGKANASPNDRRSMAWLYHAAHHSLETVLNRFLHLAERDRGASASVCSLYSSDGTPSSSPPPFLCFQRRSPGDLILGKNKVAGSAQRQRRGAVLQHGSVLWERSPCAPELLGIADLARSVPSQECVIHHWLEHLARSLGMQFNPAPLTDHERRRAGEVVRAKFESEHWTRRR